MYATLHGAFGTWPSDKSFAIETSIDDARPSSVNETFDFDSEIPAEPARPVFTLKPNNHLNGKVFVPPFFVPPGVSTNETHSQESTTAGHATSHSLSKASNPRTSSQTVSHSRKTDISNQEETNGSVSVPIQGPQLDNTDSLEAPVADLGHSQSLVEVTRPPSPEPSAAMEAERAELWSTESRKAFHEMITAPGYINRFRLHMKKRERMMQYLQNPDREPLLCDGSRDHQTKYQAVHWIVMHGKLYRKPETGRVGRYRRHLDDFEAWEVLTMEHLRSGHLGRDKLRKVLEQNYIGYTLQEIMFVLKECKSCAGRGPNAGRKDLSQDVEMDDNSNQGVEMNDTADPDNPADASTEPSMSEPPIVTSANSKGPYPKRPQTSNYMWF